MVVHQSDVKQLLHGKDDIIPLYCIASRHSLSTLYEWDNVVGPIGVNSPVTYISEPGTYRCVVTDGDGKVAYARDVVVTRGKCICVAQVDLIGTYICAVHLLVLYYKLQYTHAYSTW